MPLDLQGWAGAALLGCAAVLHTNGHGCRHSIVFWLLCLYGDCEWIGVFGLCKGHAWVEVGWGNTADRAFSKMMDYIFTHNKMKFTLTSSHQCYSS